ncbi:hypothetical protein TH53_06160 [Pedobacter lusitanus]|uniref:Uncharacterized protein n=1 Tax=Pedobacter lusitanus TaxID=1503925 RepID=A0A0D0FZM9_9SPHI|nr:hypothetical protein [Pedobacter lusitanus]KIO78009.1 hypothetical protein TH53_06160 [Pedobacter lusitanus]
MKTHFITYGDDKYRDQRKLLKQTATDSAFFDEVKIFSPSAIDPVFTKHFQSILQQPRGGGYWIWKPYFIKKTLDSLPDNDILIYADAGCLINKKGKQRFNDYKLLLEATDTGTLAFQLPHKESEYTKREVFDYFEVSDEIINSDQLMATVILLRKCQHATSLVNQWYDTLYENSALFTDEKDSAIQHPSFIDHRHDQSIFSIIRKTRGALILPDETYFQNFVKDGGSCPFWAARLKD